MTHSTKGFLAPRGGPGEPRRLTASQLQAVSQAVIYAMLRYDGIKAKSMPIDTTGDVRLLDFAESIVHAALRDYPADTSCHTCDFYHGTTCLHWKQEVPDDAAEHGCEHRAEDGAPF